MSRGEEGGGSIAWKSKNLVQVISLESELPGLGLARILVTEENPSAADSPRAVKLTIKSALRVPTFYSRLFQLTLPG